MHYHLGSCLVCESTHLQAKIKKSANILEYFTVREWEFSNENLFMLMNAMNSIDTQASLIFY